MSKTDDSSTSIESKSKSIMQIEEVESILGINYSASELQLLKHESLRRNKISLMVKRDDLLHPIISGNKWRKLKYVIKHAFDNGYDHLISMGGTWSNHLHALAYIGKKLNIRTTGLIRGENKKYNSPTLTDLEAYGMQLQFVSRDEYRQFREYRLHNDPPSIKYDGYWIPEGGTSIYALKGLQELKAELSTDAQFIVLACGTGMTLAGLMPTTQDNYKLMGIAALNGKPFLEQDVKSFTQKNRVESYEINYDYHFGGFAKITTELLEFIEQFENQTKLIIEPVYTGKLFFGLFELINKKCFEKDSQIVAIHTGGLQGKRNINN